MSSELIQVGKAKANYNVAGTRILKYSVEMYHKGLKEHKVISAPDPDILQNKAEMQLTKWMEKWEVLEARRKTMEEKEANMEEAEKRTREAQKALNQIENSLIHTLSVDDTVDWESLKKEEKFKDNIPIKPEKIKHLEVPAKPDKNSAEFTPKFTIIDKLFKSRKEKKIIECVRAAEKALEEWETKKIEISKKNVEIDQQNKAAITNWENEVLSWEERKKSFYHKQDVYNKKRL